MSAGDNPDDRSIEAMDLREFRPTFQDESRKLTADVAETDEEDPTAHRRIVLGPSRRAFLRGQGTQDAIDPGESFGEVRSRVSHPDPDVPVHAELVSGHNQRRLLFQEAPRQIRGIDGQSVSQETDGSRDGRDVREQRAMARDPFAQEAIVPLEDRTRAAEDPLPTARGA